MRRVILLGAVILTAAFGCVSSSDAYLLRILDDQAKAKALTDEGVQEYQLQLITKGDLSKIAEVREYFVVALSYDPDNVLAAQYRDLVDNFKAKRLRDKLKEANRYLAKAKRTMDEDYSLCVAVQATVSIDPSDASVTKLVQDTAKIRENLVDTFLTRVKAALAKITSTTPVATQESLYQDSFLNASRAIAVDPQNGAALSQMNAIKAELAKMYARHLDSANSLIKAGKYDTAKNEVNVLLNLNKKLGTEYDAQTRAVNYSLNYQWANNLFSRKDYAQAGVKVNAALSAQRTDEALALKKKITDIRSGVVAQESFETALKDIDSLLTQGQSDLGALLSAGNKLNALDKTTSDSDKQDQIDARRASLTSALKAYYDQAVGFYRSEDYKSAIDILQIIVQINVNYEQAADYLDKANAKQKLLDQY
jgi:hypothetical protein